MVDWGRVFSEMEKTYVAWADSVLAKLPEILAAIIILLIAYLIGKAIGLGVKKTVKRGTGNDGLARFSGFMSKVIIVTVGLILALGVLDLGKTVTSLLAGAGIIGLALGFAFQDIAANFIAGVAILIQKPFTRADIIETVEYTGTVQKVFLRTTLIKTFQGQMVHIPNRKVFENPFTNYTELGKRRIDLTIGVSYSENLPLVKKTAIAAIKKLSFIDKEKEVELFFTEFGESSINFTIRYWIDFEKQPEFLEARSEGIIAIKNAFEKAQITIPFPVRTLDIAKPITINSLKKSSKK